VGPPERPAGPGALGRVGEGGGGDRPSSKSPPAPPPLPQPPSITKMLSLLYPEYKSLLLALGLLTVATSATMQFPHAIGNIIDVLSSDASRAVIDAYCQIATTDAAIVDGTPSAMMASTDSNVEGVVSVVDIQQSLDEHRKLWEGTKSIGIELTSYFVVGAFGTFASSAIFDSTGERIGTDLRKRLFDALMSRDLHFFATNKAGELANRLSTDVHEVVEHLVHNMSYSLYNLIRALTAVASMYVISPSLTACISLPLPILLGGCAAYYGENIRHYTGRQLDVLARSTHVATERFGGISTVLSFGQRVAEQRRYSAVVEASYGYARRVAIYEGAFWGSSYAVGHAALLSVLMLGSHQVLSGSISPGHLAGFCMYAIHLTDSVVELSQATGGFLRAQGSGGRLFDLLEGRDDHEGGASTTTTTTTTVDGSDNGIERDLAPLVVGPAVTLPPSYDPTIRFEGVEFSYPTHPNRPILSDTTFTLDNGEMLAITGLSGSGKSSIVSLLMRFYEPNAGRITISGNDVRRLDVDWLRKQVGLVGQEPILFHASVYENVAYGRPDATRDEVIEACMAAGAHRFVLELPHQYDTVVGGRGANISG
jgi:ABC-type multidrug transport system fused ATPase/permease subunit